jgi:Recombinase
MPFNLALALSDFGNGDDPTFGEIGDPSARMRPMMQELAGLSARQAAAELNRRKIPTATGGHWYAATVIRLRERIVP